MDEIQLTSSGEKGRRNAETRKSELWCDRQMLERKEERGSKQIDGAPPLHTQLDSISQAGAAEAGGESQLQGVSPLTRHAHSPEPAWAWPDLSAAAACLASLQGSYCPKHTHTDHIREKNGAHRLYKLKTTYATCIVLTAEPSGRRGGSFNMFSVCDCISVGVILFFTHVTHTPRIVAQWGSHDINSAWLGSARHTHTNTHFLCICWTVYVHNEDRRWRMRRRMKWKTD